MSQGLLPPLKPLPIKERVSVVFVERGEIDMLDGAFVVVDATGVRTQIPVGGVACLMPWAKPADRLDGPPSFAAKARGCAPGLLNS